MTSQYWGEDKEIEYKRTIPQEKVKFFKDIIAFANTSGGRVILGVDEDSQEVVGLEDNNPFKLSDAITNMIADNCTPQIDTIISVKALEGVTVLEIQVFPGRFRPYYLKNKSKKDSVYIRVNGTSRLAGEAKIKELELEGQNVIYDSLPEIGVEFDETRALKLCDDMKAIALRRCTSEEDKLQVKDVSLGKLEDFGVLGRIGNDIVPTHAFMLMTDNKNSMAKIQCAVFKGTNRNVFVDRREYHGAIQEQLEEAFQFVVRNIRIGGEVKGLFTEDVYEIPLATIREAIANAVVHRSYIENSCIQVSLYDDRLEVVSPGGIYGGLRIEDIKTGRSQCRNTAIVNAFQYMKLIDSWGTGIPRIMSECEQYGLKEPIWEEFADGIKLTIFRRSSDKKQAIKASDKKQAIKTSARKQAIKTSEHKEQIIIYLKEHGESRASEIASAIGLSNDRTRVILLSMIEVVAEGNNKNRTYRLK